MAVFGLKTRDGGANTIVQAVAAKLQGGNIVKNPFDAWSYEYRPGVWVFSIEPVYPRIGALFFLPLLLPFFFPGSWAATLGLIIAAFMFSINLWWTKRFYFLLFYLKTRGRVQYIGPERALEGWYRWVSKKL